MTLDIRDVMLGKEIPNESIHLELFGTSIKKESKKDKKDGPS